MHVAIVMGSDSDLSVMKKAVEILNQFEVTYDVALASAHRTPEKLIDFVETQEEKGVAVFIAGAGMAAALPGVELEGVFSHFALADALDKSYAKEQFHRFQRALAEIEGRGITISLRHIANSAAILEMPETHLDMVRAGIILYGLWPSDEVGKTVDLRPLMTVKAKLTYVKDFSKGETISYGRLFTAPRAMRVGTLPLGYADGYTRLYTGKASVELGGRRSPVIGRICMDQCMIDVTDIEGVAEGTEVTLFGSATLSADDVAAWLGTINYEIPCLIASRVPRIYI